MISCEVFCAEEATQVSRGLLHSMFSALPFVGVKSRATSSYKGDCDWLMLYGVGEGERASMARQHVARGGRVIMWDLGYWNRLPAQTRHWRFGIDNPHPKGIINLAPSTPERYTLSGMKLRDVRNPDGPIMLCGIGKKECEAQGIRPLEWERSALKKIREHYPDRKIIYRPKPNNVFHLEGLEQSREPSIHDAMRGCSFVVCKHSNVSVDCAINGVPAICDDGIGAALYSSEVRILRVPCEEERAEFLNRAAWFQWQTQEAYQAVKFIKEIIDGN